MKHRRWIERLELSLAGELESVERDALDRHLLACAACREEYARMQRLYGIMSEDLSRDVDPALLAEARAELHGALRALPRQAREKRRWFAFRAFFELPAIRFAAIGAASFVLGLAGAEFLRRPAAEPVEWPSAIRAGETRYSNIRFLNGAGAGGDVEFTFDAVRPVRMKGRIDDELIQRVLAQAVLNEENPGVRLQSVSALSGSASADREVKTALVEAMKHDQNAGVRKEALRALRHYPFDEEIKGGLIYLLSHDSNPGLRMTVIDLLDTLIVSRRLADTDILRALQSRSQQDDNHYIRLRAKAAVEEIRQ